MNGKRFVDANVLVYAHDVDEPIKQKIAKQILRELWLSKAGTLSMQVLQEFYSVSTRKLKTRVSKSTARLVVEEYSQWCIETTPKEIAAAFRIQDTGNVNFWDALIVAAAVKSGATEILSEDMHGGQSIAGVRIVNPFAGLV